MRIQSVEEIATGSDEILGEQLVLRRMALGASLRDVAETTGADVEELAALEYGAIDAFADVNRLRLVLLAYSDYLDIDPAPLLARLEVYSGWQLLMPPNLHAIADQSAARRARPLRVAAVLLLFVVAYLGGVALYWSSVDGAARSATASQRPIDTLAGSGN